MEKAKESRTASKDALKLLVKNKILEAHDKWGLRINPILIGFLMAHEQHSEKAIEEAIQDYLGLYVAGAYPEVSQLEWKKLSVEEHQQLMDSCKLFILQWFEDFKQHFRFIDPFSEMNFGWRSPPLKMLDLSKEQTSGVET